MDWLGLGRAHTRRDYRRRLVLNVVLILVLVWNVVFGGIPEALRWLEGIVAVFILCVALPGDAREYRAATLRERHGPSET